MIQLFLTRDELNRLLQELDAKVDSPQLIKSAMGDHYPNQQVETAYITRRNIKTLLSKLDRVKSGDSSACTVVKRDTVHEKYPCSTEFAFTACEVAPPNTNGAFVYALEDDEYYTERAPGPVHPADLGALL